MSVPAYGFDKPEDAIRALEDAYVRRDANAAVAARDFVEEAKRMLVKIDAKLASEPDILKQTAEVLELGYRKELKDSTFRRFSGVSCTITRIVPVEDSLVKVLEDCTMKNGTISKEQLFVARTTNGWRVITIPN
jgi:hypothetical protein